MSNSKLSVKEWIIIIEEEILGLDPRRITLGEELDQWHLMVLTILMETVI